MKEENQVLRNENEDLKKISKENEKKSDELTKQNLKLKKQQSVLENEIASSQYALKVSETKRYLAFPRIESNNLDVNNADVSGKRRP